MAFLKNTQEVKIGDTLKVDGGPDEIVTALRNENQWGGPVQNQEITTNTGRKISARPNRKLEVSEELNPKG